jgi:peptidoglycan/xylan/chitin deacetylase (PgdA/CDA1 family)
MAAGATVYRHGPQSSKTIALTFDDGWNIVACQSILDTLRAQRVPATFFPYSSAMTMHSGSPAFWRSVAAAGYPIADHSQTHPNMASLSYDAQLAQLQNSAAAVLSITGVPVLPVFRPPGGNYNADTLAAAAAAGFGTVLLWDTSDNDTATSDIGAEIAAAEKGVDGSVVLMHCGPSTTPTVVPDVIAYYRALGFTFVTVADMFGIPYAGPPISFGPGQPAPKSTAAPTPPPAPTPTPSPAPSPTPMPTATPSPAESPSPSATPTPEPGVPASTDDMPRALAAVVLAAAAIVVGLMAARRGRRRPS